MPKNKKAEKELELKLKGVMAFYVQNYFDYYSPKLKEIAYKHNVELENDIMESQIDSYIESMIGEASEKFHSACVLVLDSIIAGRDQKVREFEILYIDLVKRTLIEDMKYDKRKPAPIVIVADSNVGAEET
jgi:hypothetical protein